MFHQKRMVPVGGDTFRRRACVAAKAPLAHASGDGDGEEEAESEDGRL